MGDSFLGPEPTRPRLKQYIVEDTTTAAMRSVMLGNPGGVFNYQNETAGFIASFDMFHSGKGADQSFWVQTDDGVPHSFNRAGFADDVVSGGR